MSAERFAFSEDDDAFRQECRDFLASEVKPEVWRWEEGHDELSWELVEKLAEGGFMGLTYPEDVGGQDRTWFEYAIAMEELGRVGGSAWLITHMQNTYPKLVLRFSEDDSLVRGIIEGEEILAFAESERQSGSDAAAIETVARREGDEYVIDGEKAFVSLFPGATYLLVTALTDPEAGGKHGMSMFLVPSDLDGITHDVQPEAGLKGHNLSDVYFDDVRVPTDSMVGEANEGFYHMRGRFDARAVRFTAPIGNALEVLDLTTEHAKQKETFGKPLLKWEDVQFSLLRHYSLLETWRTTAYRAAAMADRGERVTELGSKMKIYVSNATQDAILDCIDIWGGRAFDEEHEVYRRFTDDLGHRLAGGGTGIHQIIMGVERFGREYAVHRE